MQRNSKTNIGILSTELFAAFAIAACCLAPHLAVADGRGTLRIGGSWTGYPAHVRLAEQFTRERGVPTDVQGWNNARGFEYLRDGEMDVLIYTPVFGVPLADAVRKAFPDENHQPAAYHFGRFAVLVVVHPGNTVRKLTVEQLRMLFSGKATQWHDVAGAPRKTVCVGERPTAKSWEIMQQTVMQGAQVRIEPLDFKWSREVIAYVAKNPGAIGFCLDRREPLDGVRVLRIVKEDANAEIAPSRETILSGDYPLIEDVLLCTRPDGPELANEYCRFACGPEVSKTVVDSYYYYSSFEREDFLADTRVKDMQAGKGAPVLAAGPAAAAAMLQDLVTDFVRMNQVVQLHYQTAPPEEAVERVKMGEAELMVVDGGMEEEGLRGQGMEEDVERMVLGSRAVGVVVHPGNAFHELTMDDLRQILAGKVDRWPGATGTAERIVLYGLPAASPLMQLVDRAMGADLKRAKATVRPDSERVILSVAAQPGSLGLVDLTKVSRHETKVKLLGILQAGETEAVPPSLRDLPDDYPLAQPVHLRLSGKASAAAKSFFAFLNEGGGRDALLAGGLVPQPLPEATEAELAAAYGPVDETQTAGPPAQVAAAKEDDSPATAAPDHLQDVLRGALGGSAGASPSGAAPAAAQAGADQTAESAAADSIPLDADPATPRVAEETEAIAPAPGEGSAPHPVASEAPAPETDFAAWLTAHAVPIGLVGLGVVAVAVALGSLGMKRARHRNEVMRRYRP